MKRFPQTVISISIVLLIATLAWSQNVIVHLDFSGSTDEENEITVTSAGFGSIPVANVTFGAIPADNAFTNATDGRGIIVQAEPGEGIMILPDIVITQNAALIRCSVRADTPYASIYLATIDQGENQFVSTLTPNNGAFFHNRYQRLSNFFIPPSSGFQPIIQIVNTSQLEPLSVYLDNFEILELGPNRIDISINEIVDVIGEDETININLPGLPHEANPLELVLIKAGRFMMGTSQEKIDTLLGDHFQNESPQHQVIISNDFYIGKYEVTQAQWQALMENNPAEYWGVGPNHPVYNVSWYDCQAFIDKLNQLNQGTFRLPTEAEWEYACRAGTTTFYYWGANFWLENEDSYNIIRLIHPYCKIRVYDKIAYHYPYIPHYVLCDTQPVGLTLPNPWDLFDMIGNVSEWCQDWFGDYPSITIVDPIGPVSGHYKVHRGSWEMIPNILQVYRSATRSFSEPDFKHNTATIGIRVVRTVSTDPINTPTPVLTKIPTQIPADTGTPTPDPVNRADSIITTDLPNLPPDAKPLELVLIKAGTFMMGSPEDESKRRDNEQLHQVTLTKDFYLGKHEVTQAQWQAIMQYNPSYFSGKPDHPIDNVSWNDCQEFIARLNRSGQGKVFRLPTEAEWEYACRAGTTTRYYWGDDPDITRITDYAWWGGDRSHGTKEVGTKLPNPWGLFDMSGNVWEWCQDWYGEYPSKPVVDPLYQEYSISKVYRSCGWSEASEDNRSANRGLYDRAYGTNESGFRLARDISPETSDTPTPEPTYTPTVTPRPSNTPSPSTITVDLPNLPSGAKPLEMVLIKAGTFMMGSPQDEINELIFYDRRLNRIEGPQHQVTLTNDFFIGKYEVTQAQWETVMRYNPTYYSGKPNNPINNVSWNDCQVFIDKLNRMRQGTFRLPTEAEWEYACRAGTQSRFYWGEDPDYTKINDYCWYYGNSPDGSKEVGRKLPNAFGLFDMSGNLGEWCYNWQTLYPDRFPGKTPPDPNRVYRGGYWGSNPKNCRSADCGDYPPNIPPNHIGFRILRPCP